MASATLGVIPKIDFVKKRKGINPSFYSSKSLLTISSSITYPSLSSAVK